MSGKSKLELHKELIKHSRMNDVSYRDIAKQLLLEFNLKVDHTTIANFVKVRSRPKKVKYKMM